MTDEPKRSIRANWRFITAPDTSATAFDMTEVLKGMYPMEPDVRFKHDPRPDPEEEPYVFEECFDAPPEWGADQVLEMRRLFDDIMAIDAEKKRLADIAMRTKAAIDSVPKFTIQLPGVERAPELPKKWVSKCACQYPPCDEEEREWRIADKDHWDVVVGARSLPDCTGWTERDMVQDEMSESDDMGSSIL